MKTPMELADLAADRYADISDMPRYWRTRDQFLKFVSDAIKESVEAVGKDALKQIEDLRADFAARAEAARAELKEANDKLLAIAEIYNAWAQAEIPYSCDATAAIGKALGRPF